MFVKTYMALGNAWPWFRKWTKHLMYQFMAGYYQGEDWTFMNYGYVSLDGKPGVALQDYDERNRTCIQLYHHVANAVNLRGLDVLEVGSGRGGGADYIKRYLKPKTMTGVDYSSQTVALCRRHHHQEGLRFVTGDAEALPFEQASFDALINVESAHCYGSMDGFLAQVRRVLRPSGHFLFADFRHRDKLAELDAQLARSGLKLLKRTNITANVVKALDADHARRVEQIARGAPRPLIRLMQQFAGVKGTRMYEQFSGENIVYQSFVLQKTTQKPDF